MLSRYQSAASACICVIFFAVSFPPVGLSVAAFFCLVPLFWVAVSTKRGLNAFIVGLAIGFVIENFKFYWIYNVPGFGAKEGLVVGLYLASYYAIWTFLAKCLYHRLGISKTLILVLTCAWVCLEWLLSNLSFLSFGWATIAHTQANNLLVLQVAAVFGAYGVSFVVVMFNLLIATLNFSNLAFSIQNRENFAILGILFLFVLSWGAVQLLSRTEGAETLRVGSIQPSFTRAKALSEQDPERRLDRILKLSDSVMEYTPDLLLWPEAAVRGTSIGSQDRSVARVFNYSRLHNIAVLFGFSSVEKASQVDAKNEGLSKPPKRFNNVLFIDPATSEIQKYAKRKLMPFGEYQPIPIRNALFDAFLPEVVEIERGAESVIVNVNDLAKISPIICWEVLFDGFVRKAISTEVNLVALFNNDNWFDISPAGEQHNSSAILRAVENGRPFIVSSNTGPTIIVDKNGRVLASSNSIYDQKIVVADVPLSAEPTFYRLFGHYFMILCGCLLAVLILYAFVFDRSENT